MMSDVAILKEMIKDTATILLQVRGESQKHSLVLEEREQNKYEVIVNGMPKNDKVIVIKADCFDAPKTVFANSRHECKRADFVIVSEENRVIICLEMKAGKGNEKEIMRQLRGAKCFMEYCRAIGKEFWNCKDFLDNYEYRFVAIVKIRLPKKTTRKKKSTEIHDRPDRMLKISDPSNLQFKQLVEG